MGHYLILPRVIDSEFCHLAKGASFLSIVCDDADAAALGRFHCILDRIGQVRPAGANVGPENVRAIALVVWPAGYLAVCSHSDELVPDNEMSLY